jgi:hypothetical protein
LQKEVLDADQHVLDCALALAMALARVVVDLGALMAAPEEQKDRMVVQVKVPAKALQEQWLPVVKVLVLAIVKETVWKVVKVDV